MTTINTGSPFKTPTMAHLPVEVASLGLMLAVRSEVLLRWGELGLELGPATMAAFVDEVHGETLRRVGEFRAEVDAPRRPSEAVQDEWRPRPAFTVRPVRKKPAETKPAPGPAERKPAPGPRHQPSKRAPASVVDFEVVRQSPATARKVIAHHKAAGRKVAIYWPHEPAMRTWERLDALGLAEVVDEVILRRPARGAAL